MAFKEMTNARIVFLENISQDVKERLAGLHSFEDIESSDKIYSVHTIKFRILSLNDDTNESVKNEIKDIIDFCSEQQYDYVAFTNEYLG